MQREFVFGAALSLIAGLAAHAQPPATAAQPPANSTQVNPPTASAPPAADVSAKASVYTPGMTIKDAQGQTIGTIDRVIKTPDGATTVAAKVDGRTVNLPGSSLTLSGGSAISSMSKAQITASTAPPS